MTEPTIGQIFEPEPQEVDENALAEQEELDKAAAQHRADETKALSEAEAANYARTHAIIEPDQADDSAGGDDDSDDTEE